MVKKSDRQKDQKVVKTINDQENLTSVSIKRSEENWSECELSDGTVLRFKPVVIEVNRVEEKYTENGDPLYTVKTALIFDTKAAENLKKK